MQELESFKEQDDDYDSLDDSQRLYIKEENESMKEENSMESADGNDTRLSEMHNTTLKTEESDEDMPLVRGPRLPFIFKALKLTLF